VILISNRLSYVEWLQSNGILNAQGERTINIKDYGFDIYE